MTRRRARLVCLLPVRDGAADLPAWFESVERFADAVVALDDGSTDETPALLREHPLVELVLRNPPRPTYRGWDDAGNRSRLLSAAAAADPDWLFFLDADERLDTGDAAALVRFVSEEAVAGCAYGLRVCRMLEGLGGYDRDSLYVYRLFAFAAGQRLRSGRLHDLPIPGDIPRTHWVRTTLRIQHVGGSTPERRRARFDKYVEADPERRFQASYSGLLDAPGKVRAWAARAPGEPVLAEVSAHSRPALRAGAPAMSVVVSADGDDGRTERSLRSVLAQDCAEPFEVIVVGVPGARVRERFPEVRVVDAGSGTPPGVACNAALLRASGEFVFFCDSRAELEPGNVAARIAAHRAGAAVVHGTALERTGSATGWAALALDGFGHRSYVADRLFEAGGFRECVRTAPHVDVGGPVARVRAARALVDSPWCSAGALVADRFRHGRYLGRSMLEEAGGGSAPARAVRALAGSATCSARRLAAIRHGAHARPPLRAPSLVVAAALGEQVGIWGEMLFAAIRLAGRRPPNRRAMRRSRSFRSRAAVPLPRRS